MVKFRAILWVSGALILGVNWSRADDLHERLFGAEDEPQKVYADLQSAQFDFVGARTFSGSLSPDSPDDNSPKKISQGGAMLRSLLIPGWGESYLGYHGTARAFFWTDVALWATVIGLEVYSNWREDQFVAFAATHSGAQMSGKSEQFYAEIGNYINTEAYNEAKLLGRDFDALYTDPAYFWAWDSDRNRQEYDHIRLQSRAAHNKIYFFMGAAALNRLISVVDTGKKAKDLLRPRRVPQVSFRFQPTNERHSTGVKLILSADF